MTIARFFIVSFSSILVLIFFLKLFGSFMVSTFSMGIGRRILPRQYWFAFNCIKITNITSLHCRIRRFSTSSPFPSLCDERMRNSFLCMLHITLSPTYLPSTPRMGNRTLKGYPPVLFPILSQPLISKY